MSARLLAARPVRSGRALVVGAGIAGLLAARVLADRFRGSRSSNRTRCRRSPGSAPACLRDTMCTV
ncbi:hypothetical protein AQI95_05055 [Streptomyces yokosukanensis]|uniref:Uncharacterized protein n=1 Tax=Streptomyces yokosukanensis TaxID=67386 RepID=A0A101PCW4_9ACTN|nr:hypothetical protein [Streptomyces yokosukanensis]KUN09217.1 hypothetical protein AQI95_05055 [Streptomyces yokosukanensis]